ncbi:hypothetical protein LMG28688_03486 [Paraburkholderia caffeinitolerans]|uniref:Flp/Fap pilin component family protein n=1 Tax=Paraburkholderia caffeinitolerans TaxID=1723730 RepID=A0A6J5G606_9BURK|nr:Flp family type IVb pilin [Paraburkholderia caffeinitolerans]CAB3792333.1 hypothetical protein LMG28688_03486 [Paraburkholderia caffeinitolerans]
MQKLIATAKGFINDENGATAVEYGMMIALIAAIIVTLVSQLGTQVKEAFQAMVTAFTTAGYAP